MIRSSMRSRLTVYQFVMRIIPYAKCILGEHEFLGVRRMVGEDPAEYVFETYERVGQRVNNLAAGLATLNIPAKANVGLYSINRPEWVCDLS